MKKSSVKNTVSMKKPAAKLITKKLVAAKVPVKVPVNAVVKAVVKAPVKAVVKVPVKAVVKPVTKLVVKAPVKAVVKAPVKAAVTSVAKKSSSKKESGKIVNDLITPRAMEIKSEEELLGIKRPEDTKNKPIIPGKFDLILPPGTPRKLILNLARTYDVEVVLRTDVYVPIGVSDIQRELLAIRGDEKTLKKFEKMIYQQLEEFVADNGVAPNACYDERLKVEKAAKKAPAAIKKTSKARAA